MNNCKPTLACSLDTFGLSHSPFLPRAAHYAIHNHVLKFLTLKCGEIHSVRNIYVKRQKRRENRVLQKSDGLYDFGQIKLTSAKNGTSIPVAPA